MASDFVVLVAAGSLRSSVRADAEFPHAWTDQGVVAEMQFTGAHLLHLAVAGCVLNDVYREAAQAGLKLNGVKVSAEGDFDRQTWRSTGIAYSVQIDSVASQHDIDRLIELVDDVAEIPKAVREEAAVVRRR